MFFWLRLASASFDLFSGTADLLPDNSPIKMADLSVCFIIIGLLTSASAICFEQQSNLVLSCYDESEYNFYVNIEVLYLYDSYCSAYDLKRFFPSVRQVNVEGRFSDDTCRQIEDIVPTNGCQSKFRLFMYVFAAKSLVLFLHKVASHRNGTRSSTLHRLA